MLNGKKILSVCGAVALLLGVGMITVWVLIV